jgi:perosamine synthetase
MRAALTARPGASARNLPTPLTSPPPPQTRGRAWRRQFPVYSPLSVNAVVAGVRAAIRGAPPERARERLRTLLRDRYAPKAILLTDSGTAALTAALIGVRRERPACAAALPAFACYDVATAADGADVPVLLYDTDPRTLAPDWASLRATLRQGAAAVVVAHLYGCPADLREVNRLAAEGGAIVIEDAAQAAGALLEGRPVGGSGSLTVLSFGRGKGLTGGSGGALLAHDEVGVRILERARGLLGQPRLGWAEVMALTVQLLLVRPSVYALPAALPFLRLGRTIYRAPQSLRAPAAAACAVVAATWTIAEQEVDVRRRNAARLLVELRRQPGFQTIRTVPHARPGYLRLPVVASLGVRGAAAEAEARRLGVTPGYPQALCDLARFRGRCANRDAAFPGSRLLAARLCTLPTHSRLEPTDLTRLEQWIRAVGAR